MNEHHEAHAISPVASHGAASADAHGAPDFALYIKVFAALTVCTALSFVVNQILGENHTSAAIIMIVAVIKAVLVIAIFMHLKFDWSRLYFIIIPVVIMAIMMMVVLMPDIVLRWHVFGTD
jgi:cytochrome c oxidase subunit 4